MPTFSHLHCHSQFSLLDGAASIKKMITKAKNDNMPSVAITDHGNMFGVFEFVAEAAKQGIKPIVGCEFYLVKDRHKRQFTKEEKDRRYHQLFLAKNAEGYQNLIKLCSLGFIDGLYGKYPRIDKELVLKYHKGLIATTCCLGAEVPQAILTYGEAEAEKLFKWWLDIFGEDYYVELQRHGIGEQEKVNEVLLRFALKHNVKIIATNDSHYVNQKDANAHDILLCVNTGEFQKTPVWKGGDDDEKKPKGYRFGFFNDQFYFKDTQEMSKLFADLPQAIDNTNEIADKVETLKLKQDIMLPNYQIPEGFDSQDEYLKHLTYEGARNRYADITQEVQERIDFELFTVKTMGFAGYFLIVADFIRAGRDLGVFIGPGRGSAAGSAVAYCIGITNIDPIKYNLLFERFLNPDRKSMPDIDTDFDDEGRQKVIDYVVQKYGKNQVAQIITYGTMAAKMSIKDVARVLDLPLADANALAKLIPDKPGIKLDRVINAPISGDGSLSEKEGLNPDDLDNCKKLREIAEGTDTAAQVIKEALILEGSVRGTGIHAAGIIIAPKDLTDIIPVATAKDSDLLVTQYEGKVIEDAGVIKMDFLGLKTLSIIRDALKLIKQNYDIEIDIDNIPLDDAKTYQLYQRGETNATFQFESAGMQKYLKDLKPDTFNDLIAMNALYRPGPIEYIPNFINRKHGREPISYDLADMEEYLADTYGITVYQEQVMLLSQKIAGFTKGDADVLRKAMGKKDRKTLDKLKPQFIENAQKKGHEPKVLEKIWTDWEAFASYAFNKSHSTCYALVSFQTGYLKAHYPEEYMSAVLTNSLGNIEKITFFLEECKRMGLNVLGPDVNESATAFGVNKQKQIRFGLGAIKGAGEAAVESIITERNANGAFKDVFDFATRINLRTVNKKTFESLALAGAFDCFGLHRAQYFAAGNDQTGFIEKIIRFANQAAADKAAAQVSMFGGSGQGNTGFAPPSAPEVEAWGDLEKLKNEKEVVGFYISGHPLDQFKADIDNFCTCTLDLVHSHHDKELRIAGIVTKKIIKQTKTGNPFMLFSIEDYNASLELALFGQDYVKFGNFIEPNRFVSIRGKMQLRYGSTDQQELKVSEIELLNDVREKYCKTLRLRIDLDSLSALHIDTLEILAKEYSGKVQLVAELATPDGSMGVTMFSRSYRINPSNDFLSKIRTLEGVEYKLLMQ